MLVVSQLNNRVTYFSLPGLRLRIWSREIGSTVTSRVSRSFSTLRLNQVITHGIPPAPHASVHIYRQPPYAIGSVSSEKGHAIAYRWHSLAGVCQHRARGPQGIVPVTGAAFSGFTIDQLMCASLFTHSLLVCSGMFVHMYICMYVRGGMGDLMFVSKWVGSMYACMYSCMLEGVEHLMFAKKG